MDTTPLTIQRTLENLIEEGFVTFVDAADINYDRLQEAIENDMDLEQFENLEEVLEDIHRHHGLSLFELDERNRFEKLDFLKEHCSTTFANNTLLSELVGWMGEEDFDRFFDKLCREWEISKTEGELTWIARH